MQMRLGQFLQPALVILVRVLVERLGHFGTDEGFDEEADGFKALIQIDCPHYGFKGSAENGGPLPCPACLLAESHEDVPPQVEAPGIAGQSIAPDKGGTQASQGPFRQLWQAVVEILAGHKVEHGVTQELETLVVFEGKVRMLVQVGAMD